jgi:hypothetical protein
LRIRPAGSLSPVFKLKVYGGTPPLTSIGIVAFEPARTLGRVALLVIASGVWAWVELRAAAKAKRKRKTRCMALGNDCCWYFDE